MNLFNPLNKYVSRFMSRYMSTRMVFLLDMVMSVAASLVMLALIDLFLYSGTFSWKLLAVWTGFATVFSFLFIWQLRTYRIIIRHMTLREMALFILVAGCKVVATGIAFGLMFSFAPLLYIMVVADFFLTFGLFFLLRIAMLFVYNLVMVRMDYKAQNHNVLVYGIDIKSVSLLSRFKDSAHYNVVGFIQFGNSEVNHVISEKKVY